jgi:hypothetical protein
VVVKQSLVTLCNPHEICDEKYKVKATMLGKRNSAEYTGKIGQERPYYDDRTASRVLSKVKHRRRWLVLWWGTMGGTLIGYHIKARNNP